jgi:hypothetical protein
MQMGASRRDAMMAVAMLRTGRARIHSSRAFGSAWKTLEVSIKGMLATHCERGKEQTNGENKGAEEIKRVGHRRESVEHPHHTELWPAQTVSLHPLLGSVLRNGKCFAKSLIGILLYFHLCFRAILRRVSPDIA